MTTKPSLQQWHALHEAAAEFREHAPWNWLSNEEVFAVEDPDSGEVGYCSVLGAGGQEYGLSAFVGAQGFAGYRALVSGESPPESFEAAARLRAVALNFSDRNILDSRDLAVIRSLGLRFRGRNAWPWFRSMRPGFLPWYLEPEEASLLEHCLRQAIGVATRIEARSLGLPTVLDTGPVLTRCLRGGDWVDEWRAPPVLEIGTDESEPVDAKRLERLRAAGTRKYGTWLLDLFSLPTPISEANERPYLPLMLLVANTDGLIVGFRLLESAAPKTDALIEVLEQAEQWPEEVAVGSAAVQRLIAPVAASLGIRCLVVDASLLKQLRDGFLEFFPSQ